MKERFLSLDLARGFTVFFIAPIHVMLLMGLPEVRNMGIGMLFRFIAEGPGAQLLMVLMGISFYLGKRVTLSMALKRGCALVLVGFGLNFFKFVLPASLGLLPVGLMNELVVDQGNGGLLQLLFIGDILHFAGMAYLLLFLFSKVFKHPIWYCAMALGLCFLSPLIWDLNNGNYIWNYLLVLIAGEPPHVFFPLLPWLVYPFVGFAIGHSIRRGVSFFWLGVVGLSLMSMGLLSGYLYSCVDTSFYRTCAVHTLYHLGIVLTWISVWHVVARFVPMNWFFELLVFLSKHITVVYCLQWILIFMLLPFIGYQVLGVVFTMIICLLMEVNVIGGTYVIQQMRK